MSLSLNLEQALRLIARAKEAALDLNAAVCIAVVNSEANLIAFQRMDAAAPASTDIALRKARTAALFRVPTDELGKTSGHNQPFRSLEFSNEGLITFGGGIPIFNAEKTCLGAIGVSGTPEVERDQMIAQTGADAFAQ